ncbi:hypothetical protein KDD17_02585 [Sulfitobacter albidus]|uniref:Uncharacterized protein n=1 Tax=Sulfitobacter albidus TaxID=2829501 RepID=A0A975PN05_9RHOB|nr:hypothetical protein [Sulfitobacter albidus]QUJ76956.1 hypothetical protein KDD17_02585 [Sulfitobacter albidus]
MKKYFGFFCAAITFGVFGATTASSQSTTCELTVVGQTYINGPCDIRSLSDGEGSFQITSLDQKYFAYLYVRGAGIGEAFWNEIAGAGHAHTPLGNLRREGACWINDTARICARASEESSSLSPLGAWDCEIMRFTLSATEYNVSGKLVPVANIEQIAEDGFGITLADDYRFAVFDVRPESLTWHSPKSGDTFECQRE